MSSDMMILIVDDEKEFLELLQIILVKQGYTVMCAHNGTEAMAKLKSHTFDVVLTDMMMDDMSGLELLDYIQKETDSIESIVITAYGSVENAVEAMKKGAFSYFIKSNDPQELIFEIEKIRKIKALSEENERLRDGSERLDYILDSKSEAFRSVIRYAEKVAQTDANVLILGESGVGKEILARYIHKYSMRKQNVFMAVNCYSFSDSMIEAELYGHEKGAFTGSMQMRKGRFEAAHTGTLFLDEIGDIPLSAQAKILRNIERKEIERIGSNKTIKVDFRLISATNKDLKQEIREKRFREDLFYRISTVVLEVPALRQRREDLPILINYFLGKARKDLKKDVYEVDQALMNILLDYDYPGNVRELKNMMERLVVLAEGNVITLKDVAPYEIFSDHEAQASPKSLKEIRQIAERNHILSMLDDNGFNIDSTAEILQVSSRQLYNKIKEYKITLSGKSN